MENKKIIKIIDETLDKEFRGLVGILCKRIEVLDSEKALSTNLYKSLTKEHIYEFARSLKQLLKLKIQLGKIEFKARQE